MGDVSKIIYGDRTLIDLTSDTVDAAHLAEGYTAHGADGLPITGEMHGGTPASGNITLNAYGEYDVSDKATATYIWPMPFRAYINVSNYYWAYYSDSSTSFCFQVKTGKTYTLTWDDNTEFNLYRISFTKTLNAPSTNSTAATYRRDVFNASGAEALEHNGFDREVTFTVSDPSLVLCVVQIQGTTTLWNTGTIYSWFTELLTHLTITVN